ncbi:flippase [Shewanella colwelliana]|uniref:flippase n=1 Tax=Shewanella colwelliana TaxID=23 RepID=UPI000491A2C5|nr:flippase [Shewanella colwelliana]
MDYIKYFKNTFWIFFEQLIKLLSLFVINIFIARYLGPDKFGLLSFCVGIIAVLLTLSRLGMESVLVRELIENSNSAAAYVQTAFSLVFVAGGLCIVSLYFLLHLLNVDEQTFNYLIVLSFSLLPQAFLVLDYHFQSQVRAKFSSLAKSLALVISAIIKVYLIYIQANIFYVICAMLIESCLIAFFLLYVYNCFQQTKFSLGFDRSVAIKLLKSCFPMLLAALTTVLYMRTDQLMIKWLVGDFDLGIYSAVSRIYEMWVMVTVVLCSALLPAIVRLKENSEYVYEEKMVLLFRIIIALSFLMSLFSLFFARDIVTIVFGEDYLKGVFVFQILMWSSMFAAMGSLTMRFLTVEKLERKVALRSFFALTVNVCLNFLLIPLYGINGAAISTLISLILANYVIDFFDKDLKKLLLIKNRAILFQ